MKESRYSIEQQDVVFYFPAIDEQITRKQGGVPEYVNFDHGIARFTMDYGINRGTVNYGKFSEDTDLALMGDISVEMKIKPDNYGLGCGDTCKIVHNGKFTLGLYGGVNKYVWCTSEEITFANSATDSIDVNEWVHIVCTRSNTGVTNFYINGVLSGTANQASGTPAVPDEALVVVHPDFAFIGSIDYVKGWNRILTAEECYNLSH